MVVSAASGGVGQIAGQFAKQRNARVVGIAGRDASLHERHAPLVFCC